MEIVDGLRNPMLDTFLPTRVSCLRQAVWQPCAGVYATCIRVRCSMFQIFSKPRDWLLPQSDCRREVGKGTLYEPRTTLKTIHMVLASGMKC